MVSHPGWEISPGKLPVFEKLNGEIEVSTYARRAPISIQGVATAILLG